MVRVTGLQFDLVEYSGRALDAIKSQWEPFGRRSDSSWDWAEIMRRHKGESDRLAFAIWENNTSLCGVGLALTTGVAVELRFLEGDPDPMCKLKGRRILIALELGANYVQARGRRELRVRPINSHIEGIYSTLGFERCSPRGEIPYLVKRV